MNNYSDLNCTANEAVPVNYTIACKLADITITQNDSIDALNAICGAMFELPPICVNKIERKSIDNDLDNILENAKIIKSALSELTGRIGVK